MVVLAVFGAHAFVRSTTSRTVRMRAVPLGLQGRVGSPYATGVFGGILLGQLAGGLVARVWGRDRPVLVRVVGSALVLALLWRQLAHVAHAGEELAERV